MISEYESCPKLFYYRSWLGLKLPQVTVHFVFGNAIHEAIGNIYDQMDETSLWKLAEIKHVKEKFLSIFTIDALEKDEYASEEERIAKFEEMRDDGLLIIKDYWNMKEDLYATHDINPTQFELPIKMPIMNAAGKPLEIPMSSRLDALNYNDGIVELKTSKAKYDEVETRNLPQALSYVTLRFQQTGKMPPWLTYLVMRKGLAVNSKNRIQVLKYYYEEADVHAFVARIESILEQIRARQFNRPSIGHPTFCDCFKFSEALNVD